MSKTMPTVDGPAFGVATRPAGTPLTRGIAAAAIGATALTAFSAALEPIGPPAVAEHLELGFDTAGALIAAAGAAVVWLRCVQTRARADALLALALSLMSATGLVFAVGPMVGGARGRGVASVALLGGWVLAAAVLATVALARDARVRSLRATALRGAAACAIALASLSLLGAWVSPAVVTAGAPAGGVLDAGRPLARALQLAAAAAFLVATAALAPRASRDQDRLLAWVAIAAVLGAVLHASYALFPALHSDFAFRGDLVGPALSAALGAAAASGLAEHRRRAARSAALEERRRLARELHDGLAQELAFIATHAPALTRDAGADPAAGLVAKAAERALEESRATIAVLREPSDGSLRSLLHRAAAPLADRGGAELTVTAPDGLEVEPQVAEALGRIVREATGNAIRHGRAAHVAVIVDDHAGLRVRVRDDGCGFDTSALRAPDAFGLIGMRERAEALGATFEVRSAPGAGTEIEVAW